MTTADQLAVVNKILSSSEQAYTIVQASIVIEFTSNKVVLVLVRCQSETAIFIIKSSSLPISKEQDLNIINVVPIDQSFKFDIESGHSSLGDGVFININTNRQKFTFEMFPGYHTQNFVSELYRVTDGLSQTIQTHSFSWIDKYKSTDTPLSEEVSQSNDSVKDLMSDMMNPTAGNLSRDRESVVSWQLSTKLDQYTTSQRFTVFSGTYNVNGRSPDSHLRDWLAIDKEPPDIYVLGFQELDLSKEAYIFTESVKEEEWIRMVSACLHSGAKYSMIRCVRLVGIMMLVYTKSEHVEHVSNISDANVGTGIMGKLGNKGGVAVCLRFHATELCFVNSHLAAHQDEYERRNQDYQDICTRLLLSQFDKISHDYPLIYGAKRLKDFDSLIWVGDLNYRLNDLDVTEVKDMLAEDNIEALLECDQLKIQQHQRKAFVEFKEGKIKFIPTYKYDIGKDDWDTSEKSRAPAWTDRILWKGDNISQIDYRSCPSLRTSDHKPVSALFNVNIRVIDKSKRQKIKEDIMKKLDILENDFLPQVMVDKTEVVFENIKFLEPESKSISVANTGQVPAQFEFIPKPNEDRYAKHWLVAEPCTGLIMPGDKCDVVIQVLVDKKTAHTLNSGKEQLYDILVLHLNGGKDIFITVDGSSSYVKSCFGCSISALVNLTVPISELNSGQIVNLETGNYDKLPLEMTDGNKEAYPVPKELWYLCDLLTSLGLHREHLFLHPGLKHEILQVRDWLDTGEPVGSLPQVSPHSAAETLMIFLESLREPVIPFNVYSRCLECCNNYLQCKQIISQLPPHHKHVFDYLTAFLREVISHSATNGIDTRILATLFSTVVFRDPPNTNLGVGLRAKNNQQMLDAKKTAFLLHFLTNTPDD